MSQSQSSTAEHANLLILNLSGAMNVSVLKA